MERIQKEDIVKTNRYPRYVRMPYRDGDTHEYAYWVEPHLCTCPYKQPEGGQRETHERHENY